MGLLRSSVRRLMLSHRIDRGLQRSGAGGSSLGGRRAEIVRGLGPANSPGSWCSTTPTGRSWGRPPTYSGEPAGTVRHHSSRRGVGSSRQRPAARRRRLGRDRPSECAALPNLAARRDDPNPNIRMLRPRATKPSDQVRAWRFCADKPPRNPSQLCCHRQTHASPLRGAAQAPRP